MAPITREDLRGANSAMLHNTNRAMLLATVNLSADAPRLEDMLAYLNAGVLSWSQFYNQVRERLVVTSFAEFLDKFEPCFYYRLRPAEADEAARATEGEYDLGPLPSYEFSLEGGPGWKRVPINENHPFVRSLRDLIAQRARLSRPADRINIDAALFGFRPGNQRALVRKAAQSLQADSQKLLLEMKRNTAADGSVRPCKDVERAREAYDRRVKELTAAMEDDMRLLPTVAYGLAEARKALHGGGAVATGPVMDQFMLTIGRDARVVALPEARPDRKQLPAGQAATSQELMPLREALESRPLARRELTEIAQLPSREQFPKVVGSFMSELVRLNKIDPLMGNLMAVVINDPKELATWGLNAQELDVYHDTFLGIYSKGVQDFLRAVTPLFETIMGVYMLFNELPPDVPNVRPELIVANGELTDLWQTYQEELTAFLRASCHQAANQYRDAISFVIVPSVAPLLGEMPKSPNPATIRAGEFEQDYRSRPEPPSEEDRIRLDERIEALRHERVREQGGFGRVTGAPETLGLMELGNECGFQVFFSPEERVIAGSTRRVYLQALHDQYCPEEVVTRPWAVNGIACLPDFVCLPPDGLLITGSVVDGRPVGVEVPAVVVRACYVAAGRFMANDEPKVLQSIVAKRSAERRMAQPLKIRPNLPGVGVDLTRYTQFGSTRLAVDHFLDDDLLRELLGRDRSFLVLTHVNGCSPSIAAPRTLGKVITEAGDRYRLIHHYRQEVYLRRLVLAAFHLAGGGALPNEKEMTNLMDTILNWVEGSAGWYDAERLDYVNAFPSELRGDAIGVTPIEEGAEVVGFNLRLDFKAGVLGEMQISF